MSNDKYNHILNNEYCGINVLAIAVWETAMSPTQTLRQTCLQRNTINKAHYKIRCNVLSRKMMLF